MRAENAFVNVGFGTPAFRAAQEAEVASRPVAVPRPGPLSPAEIELHRKRGAAARGNNKAEVMRLGGLIKQAEHDRRITALEQSHSPAHLRGMEKRG